MRKSINHLDKRHRFRCNRCGGVTRGIYSKVQSDKSREIVYRCGKCEALIKTIETIVEAAYFQSA